MFSRLSRGWSIAQAGWLIIVDHPKLLLLPVFSGVALLVLLGAIVAPVFALGVPEHVNSYLIYAVFFVVYLAATFVMIFFNAALVFCAISCFRGEEPSLVAGLAAARARGVQILDWAVVAATVGLLLNWLQNALKDNLGWFGSLFGIGLEVAWAATTYFVVPVLVVEGLGPIDAIKRSSAVLRQTWGEVVGAEAGLGLVGFILIAPAVLLAFLTTGALGGVIWVITVLYAVTVSVVLAAVGTIFQTGAYLYGVSGQTPAGMNEDMFRNAFRKKGE